MTDLTPFERRLGDRLEAALAGSVEPIDPARVAAAAMVRRSPRDRLLNRLGVGPLPVQAARSAAAMVTTLLVLALVAAAIAAGLSRPGDPAIAFVRTNGELVLAAADGAAARVVAHLPAPVRFTQLEWAPGGGHLAILDEALRLTIFTSQGAIASQRDVETGTSRFEWAPDGRRLAILDGPMVQGEGQSCSTLVRPRLDIVSPDGAVTRTVALPAGFRYPEGLGELTWSPDGRRLAIVGSVRECSLDDGELPTSIWLVDVESDSVRELTAADPTVRDFHPFWLPDGRLLFSQPETGLLQADPATGATSVVLDLARACEGCAGGAVIAEDVSRDGRWLALRHSTLRPLALDLASGAVTIVPRDPEAVVGRSPVSWDADGSRIVFDVQPTPGAEPIVVAVDIATGAIEEVLSGTEFFAIAG
jgi:Tol biopolymer transport system component